MESLCLCHEDHTRVLPSVTVVSPDFLFNGGYFLSSLNSPSGPIAREGDNVVIRMAGTIFRAESCME